jgi:hypothetical protein
VKTHFGIPQSPLKSLFNAGVAEGVGHGLAMIVKHPRLCYVILVENGQSERGHVGFIRRFSTT